MRSLAAVVAVLVLGAVGIAGCGGGDENADKLSRRDAQNLANSRSDLDDALDTEETLRTSKAEATRLRARVQKIISQGSLENGGKPDEFGLAALGQLREQVPSLVVEEGGEVQTLDGEVTSAFMTYALKDPAKALFPAAATEVRTIERAVDGDDVGPDTKIPPLKNETVGVYLRQAERDLRPVWPQLAGRVAKIRDDL